MVAIFLEGFFKRVACGANGIKFFVYSAALSPVEGGMISTLLTVLDVLALLLLLPTVCKHLYSYLVHPSSPSRTYLAISSLYRKLDEFMHHHLTPISYLLFDYLLIRMYVLLVMSSVWIGIKVLVGVLLLVVVVIMVFPFIAPIHVLLSLFCRNSPYLPNKDDMFPHHSKFENPESWKRIQKELLDFLAQTQPQLKINDFYPNITIAPKEDPEHPEQGWRMFVLRGIGYDVTHNVEKLPYLSSIIREIPDIYNAFLSILDPGKTIPPHRGYYKGFIRYHLGMVVPEPSKSYLICGGERYHWEEGVGVLFDDVFIHSATNQGELPRIVLFVDVVRRLAFPLSVLNRLALFLVHCNPWLYKTHMRRG